MKNQFRFVLCTAFALMTFLSSVSNAQEVAAPQKIVSVVNSDKGLVLAGGQDDKTLYTFDPDVVDSGASSCNGQCAVVWPPLVTELAAIEAPFSIVKRADGQSQIALNGKPLYFFDKDLVIGQTDGDGVAGVWHIIKFAP